MGKIHADRDRAIVYLFKEGVASPLLAKAFGLSTQRIGKIIKNNNVAMKDGGRAVAVQRRREAREKKINDRFFKLYGIQKNDELKIPKEHRSEAKATYRNSKKNFKKQPTLFKLNLMEFWTLWRKSRKFTQRGTGTDKYNLTRLDYSKPLSFKNAVVEKRADTYRRVNGFKRHD